MNKKQYRYPGATPFTTGQQHIFFGRRQDTEDLCRLIRREALVVLYGKSGLGKSSLLNAGIVPAFLEEGVYTPIVIRFGAWTEGKTESPLSLTKAALTEAFQAVTFLAALLPGEDSLWYHAKNRQLNGGGRPLLLFDQFEELFSYPDNQVAAFQQELAELRNTGIPLRFRRRLEAADAPDLTEEAEDLLESPLEARLLFAIRSDRMHLLNRLSDYLPNVLRHSYELKALTLKDARDAIVLPAAYIPSPTPDPSPKGRGEVPFSAESDAQPPSGHDAIPLPSGEGSGEGLAESDPQSQSRHGAIPLPSGEGLGEGLAESDPQSQSRHGAIPLPPGEGLGEGLGPPFVYSAAALERLLSFLRDDQDGGRIEGILLQMLCEHYERKQVEALGHTLLDLPQIGDPNEVVRNYYEEKIRSLPTAQQPAARLLIEDGLVSDGEAMRLSLHEAYIAHEFGVGKPLLETLVDSRLLRSEPFLRGGYTYELSHDRLVPAVLGARNQRREEEAHAEARRLKAEAEKTRRQLRTVQALLVAAVLALVFAGWQYFEADKAKQRADQKTQDAEKALNDYKAEQAAKALLEFKNKESRANIILDNGGCPIDLLKEMREIANGHPDSVQLLSNIQSLQSKNVNCQ